MAKSARKKDIRRRSIREEILPLGKDNYRIIGIGLVVIVIGYIAMIEGSVEGFLPLVAAPILLVVGYCVIIPFGIMYRKGMGRKNEQPAVPSQQHS